MAEQLRGDSKGVIPQKNHPAVAKHIGVTKAITAEFALIAQQQLRDQIKQKRQQQKAREAKKAPGVALGEGGQSIAFAVTDAPLACIVPSEQAKIKVDPKTVQKQELEKFAAFKKAGLNSPFLQSFILLGETERVSLLGKRDLFSLIVEEHLQKGAKISAAEARDLIMQMLLGIKALHVAGFAHLDIKLENIIVMSEKPLRIMFIDIPLVEINKPVTPTTFYDFTPAYVPAVVKERGRVNLQLVFRNPQVMDVYALRVMAGIILAATEDPDDDLLDVMIDPNDSDTIPVLYEYADNFDNNPSVAVKELDALLNLPCFGANPEERRRKSKELIEDAQANLDQMKQSFYENTAEGLTSFLQIAPPEIRELNFLYQQLRLQEKAFLEIQGGDSSWIALNSIKRCHNVLMEKIKVIEISTDPRLVPYKATVAKLSPSVLLNKKSEHIEKVVDSIDRFMKLLPEIEKVLSKKTHRLSTEENAALLREKTKLLHCLKEFLATIDDLSKYEAPKPSLLRRTAKKDLAERQCGAVLQSLRNTLQEFVLPLERQMTAAPVMRRMHQSLQDFQTKVAGAVPSSVAASPSPSPSPEVAADSKTSRISPLKQMRLGMLRNFQGVAAVTSSASSVASADPTVDFSTSSQSSSAMMTARLQESADERDMQNSINKIHDKIQITREQSLPSLSSSTSSLVRQTLSEDVASASSVAGTSNDGVLGVSLSLRQQRVLLQQKMKTPTKSLAAAAASSGQFAQSSSLPVPQVLPAQTGVLGVSSDSVSLTTQL